MGKSDDRNIDDNSQMNDELNEQLKEFKKTLATIPENKVELAITLTEAIATKMPDADRTLIMYGVMKTLEAAEGKEKVNAIRMLWEAGGILKAPQAPGAMAPVQFTLRKSSFERNR